MKREQTITELCELVSAVYGRIDPECSTASDCFCHSHTDIPYRNEGKAVEYVKRVVLAALEVDFPRKEVG